mgnify:CR=1 FL=1
MSTLAPGSATETLPQTIDQVLVRLNGILDDALRGGTRIGYFAALYERVTTNVRRALVAGLGGNDGGRGRLRGAPPAAPGNCRPLRCRSARGFRPRSTSAAGRRWSRAGTTASTTDVGADGSFPSSANASRAGPTNPASWVSSRTWASLAFTGTATPDSTPAPLKIGRASWRARE